MAKEGETPVAAETAEGGGIPQPPAGVGVRLVGVSKAFGPVQVLKDLSLEVFPGETFVIIGPSGCGKTVLLRHILGLVRPDHGQILLDGEEVGGGGGPRKHRIAMVFQSSALFHSLTVADNVALWLREHRVADAETIRRVVEDQLNLVGLREKQDLMPSELSGGMKKRVAIARALAMNPSLILYDEPTAELDPVMTDVIAEVILDLKRRLRITVIVVTHDLNMGSYVADRMAMLHEGQIIEVGTPAEIRQSTNAVVRAFISTQTKGMGGM
ncbi:MAG: ABC transporter ATP-binding protein [Candidatus Methylomirabilales bacterium]